MIDLQPFISTKPQTATIGGDTVLEVKYSVVSDKATEITSTYTAAAGCKIVGNASIKNKIKQGSNDVKDTITVNASNQLPQVSLRCCNSDGDCDSGGFGFFASSVASKAMITGSEFVRLKEVVLLNNKDGASLIHASKKTVRKFLKEEGYAYNNKKKIWQKLDDKN